MAAAAAVRRSRGGTTFWSLWIGSIAALALVGLLGDSAASPGLGSLRALPPWDLGELFGASSAWLVTALSAAGYLLGGLALYRGLRAAATGRLPVRPRNLLLAGVIAALALTLVPPIGSADHLSYLAYGRITAAGDDPYLLAPGTWHGGTDPVASAVQPPWQNTPSVYGPLANAAFAVAAALGGGSLRTTVWAWSLICAACFVAVALMIERLARSRAGSPADDASAPQRLRATLLWTANPLLLGQLVLGAHVDVLATALGVAAILPAVLGRMRTPAMGLAAGALVAAAGMVKVPYLVLALALLWGLRPLTAGGRLRVGIAGVAGALAVLLPALVLAGPHVFDQLGTASGFTSIASPWRAVVNLVELLLGSGAMRAVLVPLSLLLAALLAVVMARRTGLLGASSLAPDGGQPGGPDGRRGGRTGGQVGDQVALVALVTCAAWVLCAPYTLPWYDAMLWAPLALVAAGAIDPESLAPFEFAVLARLTVLAIAYVPGRVLGMSPALENLTLGLRRYLAPLLILLAVAAVLRWALQGRGAGRSHSTSPPAAAG